MARPIVVKVSSGDNLAASHLTLFEVSKAGSSPDFRFFVNEPCAEADFWFVFGQPHPWDLHANVPPSRVYLALGETCLPDDFYLRSQSRREYIEQFAAVYSSQPLDLRNAVYTLPLLPWMINSNHGTPAGPHQGRDYEWLTTIRSIPKPLEISVFCSNKSEWPGHLLRLRFVEKLKALLGPRLHWYGNGINSLSSKWDGLAPYKYSIVLENQSARNVVTEKIFDSLLAFTLPLYWGAPNIGDFLPALSFQELDIRDLNGAIGTVERLLDEDPWEDRLPVLTQARHLVLTDFNMLERIKTICRDDYGKRGPLPKTHMLLQLPVESRMAGLRRRIIEKGLSLGTRHVREL